MTRHLPLRVRLTIWYSLVFAIALLGVGVSCLWMVHRAITELENNELQQRVRSVKRFLEVRPPNEDPAMRRAAIATAYDVSHGNKWLQVIDEHGNWLYRSAYVAAVYPSLELPTRLSRDSQYFTYVTGSLHVRALIAPIAVNGVRYTVQTGLTLNKPLTVLNNFRYQLFFLITVGLLASTFAGYFMSSQALTPIAAIANQAQHINDRNLDTRLPELASRDELASLTATLNQMLSRIESGYQSVRSFTANAAHELRTPVALLRAEAEVALAFPRDANEYRETCQRFLQNSTQMSRLIEQLLALARADAGAETLSFERLNLYEFIQEMGATWESKFHKADLHFEVIAEPTTEQWTIGDYLALKRVLNALLENAWRYTPSYGAVALILAPQENGTEISVRDNGIGISSEDQASIFQRFYRAANPLRGESIGSGLGLVLAQWIAGKHDSQIQCESSLGKGSRFYFLLRACSAPIETVISDKQIIFQ